MVRYSEQTQKAAVTALDAAHRMGILRVGNPWHPIAEAIVTARDNGERAVWLIELRGTVPHWWSFEDAGEDDPDGTWTHRAHAAVQFARKQDADNIIKAMGWTEAFSSEHIFSVAPSDGGAG